jgi:hypothetical protein
MSATQVHLITSHAPVFAILFGLVIWLAGLVWRKVDFRRAALLLFLLAGLLAVPAFVSGRPALKAMEFLPGVNRHALDQHEEVAMLALAATALLGLAAGAGLVAFRKAAAFPRWFGGVTLALALVSGALMIWTASLGGQGRHSEISRSAR